MAVPCRNSLQKGTVNTVSTVDRRTLLVIPGTLRTLLKHDLLRFAHIILGVLGNSSYFVAYYDPKEQQKVHICSMVPSSPMSLVHY